MSGTMEGRQRNNERALEKLPPVSMDYRELAALVFELNKLISTAKKHVIGKLSRKIKSYRSKSEKKVKEDDSYRASHQDERCERLIEQITAIKSLDAARISKFSLANEDSVDSVSRKTSSSSHLIGLVRLAEDPIVKNYVHHWRSKHSDWKVLANFLLSKNTNRLFKRRNQKKMLTTDKLIVDREMIKHRLQQDNADVGDIDKPLMERTSRLGAKHSQKSQERRIAKNEELTEKISEQSEDSDTENSKNERSDGENVGGSQSSDSESESGESESGESESGESDEGASDKDETDSVAGRPDNPVDDDGFDSEGYDDLYQSGGFTELGQVDISNKQAAGSDDSNSDTNQSPHTRQADSDSDESSLDENDLLTFNIVEDDLKQMERDKTRDVNMTKDGSRSISSLENSKIKSLAAKLLSGSNKESDKESSSESDDEEPVTMSKISGEMVTARLDITSLKKSNFKSLDEITPNQPDKHEELPAPARRKKSSFFMGGEVEIDVKLGSSRYEQEKARRNQRSGDGYKGVKKSEKKWVKSAFTDSLRGSKKTAESSLRRNHDQMNKGDQSKNQQPRKNNSKFSTHADEKNSKKPYKEINKTAQPEKKTAESIESLHPSWQARKKQKMQLALIQNGPKATKKTFDDSD